MYHRLRLQGSSRGLRAHTTREKLHFQRLRVIYFSVEVGLLCCQQPDPGSPTECLQLFVCFFDSWMQVTPAVPSAEHCPKHSAKADNLCFVQSFGWTCLQGCSHGVWSPFLQSWIRWGCYPCSDTRFMQFTHIWTKMHLKVFWSSNHKRIVCEIVVRGVFVTDCRKCGTAVKRLSW